MAKKQLTIYTVTQITTLIKVALEETLPAKIIVSGEISGWKIHSSGHCYFSLKDHDITDSIQYRWPCAKLFLYPVLVQGEGAAEDIANAINNINKRNSKLKLDILIVGRGGGSLEDLWAFNEEAVARAIFASQIPVISAVGHEVDVTIADLVADARASTPTKAAVIAVPDITEVLANIIGLEKRLSQNAKASLQLAGQSLQTILAGHIFKNPLVMVLNRGQQLDEIQMSLISGLKQLLAAAKERLHLVFEQIIKIEPHRLLGRHTVDLNNLQNRLAVAAKAVTNKAQVQLTAQENRLAVAAKAVTNEAHAQLTAQENRLVVSAKAVTNKARVQLTAQANLLAGLNPKSVLNRGYSITTGKKTGRVIKRADDIEVGDIMLTELAQENLIESKVTKK